MPDDIRPDLNNPDRQPLPLNHSFQPSQPSGPDNPLPPTKKRLPLPAFWYRLSRKAQVLSVLAVVLILGAAAAAVFSQFGGSGGSTNVTKVAQKEKKPTTVASPLTGVQVAPDLAKRPVTAIMIENSPDSRPQSGIDQAGVIFEAIAEGGITRFLTLYQEAQPAYVGPVRSLRPYYIDWAAPFDAGIAHVGGSPEALAQIRSSGKDLDQFFNSGSYWRQNTRSAPHNVYTSFEKMDALNKAKGFTSSNFKGWLRKADKPLQTPTAKSIDMPISSSLYHVHYNYDPVSNLYLRHEGGPPHNSTSAPEDKTGIQLRPKVVITLVMSYSINADGQHSEYGTNGSGSVYVFQDGGVTQGTWSKANRSSQFEFKDQAGKPIALNAGQTWLTVVQNGQMSYTP